MPVSQSRSGGGEEETLLSAPGKRNDSVFKTHHDKRDLGARKRHYKSKWSDETGKMPSRQKDHFYYPLRQLSKGIVEDLSTNYKKSMTKEELEVLQNDVEIQTIIENLDSKKREA